MRKWETEVDGQAGESRHFVVNDLNYVDDTRRKSRIIIKGNHRDETHFKSLTSTFSLSWFSISMVMGNVFIRRFESPYTGHGLITRFDQ